MIHLSKERELLIKRNQRIVSIPMPDLNNMTNEELKKRADMLEWMFADAFKENFEAEE